MVATKLNIFKARIVNFFIKLLFLLISIHGTALLFWLILKRHDIPASAIYQSDALPIAMVANFIISRTFNDFLVIMLIMSATHFILKNKECLIMKKKCHCGYLFTIILSANDNYAGGKNFICQGCERIGWVDSQTGSITLFPKPDPDYLKIIVNEKN